MLSRPNEPVMRKIRHVITSDFVVYVLLCFNLSWLQYVSVMSGFIKFIRYGYTFGSFVMRKSHDWTSVSEITRKICVTNSWHVGKEFSFMRTCVCARVCVRCVCVFIYIFLPISFFLSTPKYITLLLIYISTSFVISSFIYIYIYIYPLYLLRISFDEFLVIIHRSVFLGAQWTIFQCWFR